jgi:hypothetical protein
MDGWQIHSTEQTKAKTTDHIMNIKCAKHKKINIVCMVHYYLPNHTRFISTFSIKNRGVTFMLQSILLHMPVVVQLVRKFITF